MPDINPMARLKTDVRLFIIRFGIRLEIWTLITIHVINFADFLVVGVMRKQSVRPSRPFVSFSSCSWANSRQEMRKLGSRRQQWQQQPAPAVGGLTYSLARLRLVPRGAHS